MQVLIIQRQLLELARPFHSPQAQAHDLPRKLPAAAAAAKITSLYSDSLASFTVMAPAGSRRGKFELRPVDRER
jgi:hypothetical protein